MSTLIVISDLHIASGPLDDCDAELEHHFVAFLERLSQEKTGIELVLNGDFLDFVQAEPWSGSDLESESADGIPLCFTEEQSIAKLESIYAAHRPVFGALKGFLNACPDNRVTVLPGNHDADFYWEGVRKKFGEYISPINFFLEQVYRPIAHPSVWIEHGHQSDPVNCFEWKKQPYWSSSAKPIFRDRKGTNRLYECTGTRFLIKFLNRLDLDYPFVDNVKPFSRFVRLFGASAFAANYGKMKVAVAMGRMLSYLYSTVVHHGGDVLAIQKETDNLLRPYLLARMRAMPNAGLQAVAGRMDERGFIPEMPLRMYLESPAKAEPVLAFFANNPDLLEALEVPGAAFLGADVPGTLTLAAGFTVDETKELAAAAQRALVNPQVDLVLMGHTHEKVGKSDLPYINTGCWTRYYRFNPAEKKVPWEILQSNSYLQFPYELNYVEVAAGKSNVAQLATYQERHAEQPRQRISLDVDSADDAHVKVKWRKDRPWGEAYLVQSGKLKEYAEEVGQGLRPSWSRL